MSLFDNTPPAEDRATGKRPLAERMRPERLEDYVGQEHILGPGKPLRRQIERDELTSIILWGPPGVGKTTLAKLIARVTRCEFIPFSAVLSGIKEIKAVMADAEKLRNLGMRTILFIDEIHRFNKAQQDAFLPYVERGDIILIGATTENPSFEVISALLSRSRVYALRGLTVPETDGTAAARAAGGGAGGAGRTAGTDRDLFQRRRAAGVQHAGSGRGRRAGRRADGGGGAGCDAAQGAAVRQGRRRAFQPDLGAAQIGAVERCGRGAVLADAHAGGRAKTGCTSRGG